LRSAFRNGSYVGAEAPIPVEEGFFGGMLDVLEVGVFKVGRVLEAESEKAVETHVGGPDEGDREELWLGGEVGDGEQDPRSEISVGKIIDSGADADVGEIAEHEEVWRQEEDGEEEPVRVQLVIEEDSYDEDCGAFEMEEEPWFH
jgi:hypothetical protein